MRTASSALVALVTLLAAAPAAPEELNRIVLRVNDQIATLDDYVARRDGRIEMVSHATDLSDDDKRKLIAESGKASLREMFEEMLVMSRAQQLRLEASPAEIDRAVENARKRFGIESDAEFSSALEQSGSSIDEFRKRMARNIVFNQVMQREINPKIKIDDEEVARYWRDHPQEFQVPEKRQVEEIVVRNGGRLDAAGERALAVRLRDDLVGGKSVADAVAAESAADDVLPLDHGWIERGTLDTPLETTVWELGAGGVGGPIDARGGLHVLRVVAIEPQKVKPLEEVRAQVLAKLQDEEFDRQSRAYLDDLARKAYIVENLPADAVGYRTASTEERDPVREMMRGTPPKSEQKPEMKLEPQGDTTSAPSDAPTPPPAQ